MSEIIPTKKHPLNFELLQKGTVISIVELEQATGETYGTDAYRIQVLRLQLLIQVYFEFQKGEIVTFRTCKGVLIICDDDQASELNHDRFGQAIKRMLTIHRKMQGVDVSKLSGDRRKKHERNLLVQSQKLQAMAKSGQLKKLQA